MCKYYVVEMDHYCLILFDWPVLTLLLIVFCSFFFWLLYVITCNGVVVVDLSLQKWL